MKKTQKIYLPFKRLIDILGSLVGIIVCFSFLWWWVFIVNLIVTKGHPVFSHPRIGKDAKPFHLVKFRSMKLGTDVNLTSDEISDDCLTGFGKFLRVTSIDETLQLIHVLTGKMSFIGPRPLIDKSIDHITIEKRKSNGAINIQPGITGYAQINGRTDISGEEKGILDGYYYQHFSLWLDIRIFIITILQLFGFCKKRKKPLETSNE